MEKNGTMIYGKFTQELFQVYKYFSHVLYYIVYLIYNTIILLRIRKRMKIKIGDWMWRPRDEQWEKTGSQIISILRPKYEVKKNTGNITKNEETVFFLLNFLLIITQLKENREIRYCSYKTLSFGISTISKISADCEKNYLG